MDRPDRFTANESKSYEPSLPPPYPPSDTAKAIDFHDTNGWLRRQRQQEPRSRRQDMEDPIKAWPTEKSVPSPVFQDDISMKTPDPRYDQDFLHPQTPKRASFFKAQDTTELRPRRLSVNLEQSSRFGWWTLCLFLVTLVMIILTVVYSDGTAKSLWQDKFFTTSPSHAILILRTMTEACALLLATLIVVVVEDLQWALASRPQGVGLLHFIGLDSGTGVWGLLRLLATADWRQKYSSLFRLLVICLIPLPGITLMGDITLQLVFFPQGTYDVAAGVGQFDASYISQVDDSVSTALLISMGSPSWSTRDTFSTNSLGRFHGGCTTPNGSWTACDESHLLVGGVLSISPQKDNYSVFPDSTAYVVPSTRSVQLEYGDVHDLEGLYSNGTCYFIGSSSAASYWCTDTGPDEELLLGSSYCPLAIQFKQTCLNDTSWTKPLQIASSLFAYKRYGTVNYDRGNLSILSVTDLTVPERQIVKLEDYMLALSAVVPGFSPTNSSSNSSIKGDNSALAIYAVTALPINDNELAKKQSLQATRKAMSVPFNYFHANYFAEPSVFVMDEPRKGLDDDMYTTLSISVLSHQVVAGYASRWVFGMLSGLLLTLVAATMVATLQICGRTPQRCGYPTLDFAAVCAVKGGIPEPGAVNSQGEEAGGGGGEGNRRPESGLYRSLTALGQKPAPFQVASRIKDQRVMLGK